MKLGPAHLTLTADEGVSVAEAMPHAVIVPLHYEGWQHFSQGRADIQRAFDGAGLSGPAAMAGARRSRPSSEIDPLMHGCALGFPEWIEPMAATLTQERFIGSEWTFERKLDGIRLVAFKQGSEVRLFRGRASRRTSRRSRASIAELPAHDAILDGELTWESGRRRLPRLRRRLARRSRPHEPAAHRASRAARRAAASRAAASRAGARLTPSRGSARAREGWEGVIAKRLDSPYEQKRSKHWLKMKCETSQDFVVGGFTDPQGARVGLGALLVGYFEGDDFVFAGKVGTGLRYRAAHRASRAARRARDRRRRRSRKRPGCRASARTG